MSKVKGPRVLFLDIETAPILAHVWALWDQNVALNMIKKDWHLLSWSAKWAGDPASKTMYYDQSKVKNIEDDSGILKKLWAVLDEADVVVTHNGKKFDEPKIFARMLMHGMKPPSPFKSIDTCSIAKRKFGFTSNKLEYLTDKLNKKYKKLKHKKFPGFEMWAECLAGNKEAWKCMKKYNMYDVLSLEEVFEHLRPWAGNLPNFTLYTADGDPVCQCGSEDFHARGYAYTATGKYQRYQCQECGAWTRSGTNLLAKKVRKNLKRNISG